MAEHTGRTGATPPRITEATLPDIRCSSSGRWGKIRQVVAFDHHTVLVTDEIRTERIANLVSSSPTSIEPALDLAAPDRIGRGRAARGAPLADLLAACRLEPTGRAAVTTARPERYRSQSSSFRPEGHAR